MSNTIVISHQDCPDGFCAAWAVRKAIPDAEFVFSYHNTEPPDVVGKKVIITDFSYKADVFIKLMKEAETVLLLDHHKTAQEELGGKFPNCEFDMNHSGARLAWDKFVGGKPSWLVDYVEDKDLWRWALPNSREINSAIASYPFDFKVWDELGKKKAEDMVADGQAIMRYKNILIQQSVKTAWEGEMGGYRIPIANVSSRNLLSEVAGFLARGKPFAACYYDTPENRLWSLRSREGGIDVSEIAQQFGGGGHAQASGFSTAKNVMF